MADQKKPDDKPEDNPEMQGEGNYTAARHYNDATKRYVDSGKVDSAAHAAQPKSPKEARDMESAEQEGKSHAKEEDPALRRGAGAQDGGSTPGKGADRDAGR